MAKKQSKPTPAKLPGLKPCPCCGKALKIEHLWDVSFYFEATHANYADCIMFPRRSTRRLAILAANKRAKGRKG